MLKDNLIFLVRLAQAEQDPVMRKVLWDMIEEAGLPPDASVWGEAEELKEKNRGRLLDQKEGGTASHT